MTASPRNDLVPTLGDYPHRLSDNVRFADLDINKHVNNAVYSCWSAIPAMASRRKV